MRLAVSAISAAERFSEDATSSSLSSAGAKALAVFVDQLGSLSAPNKGRPLPTI